MSKSLKLRHRFFFSERICEQSVDVAVPHVDVKDMNQITPEIQQLRERSAMLIAGATVPPDTEEIAKVHELLIKVSKYGSVFEDEVIFPKAGSHTQR